jgi:uncharacterized protein YukE
MSDSTVMGQGEGTLSRAGAVVAEARAELDGLTQRLDAQLGGLGARWQGAGGSAFLALHRAWSERQRTITGSLTGFEAALSATERDNFRTDLAQAAAYRRVAERLG